MTSDSLYCKAETLFLKQSKAGGDGIRVVEDPPVPRDFLQRILKAQRRAVGAVGRHGFDHVGNRQDFRFRQKIVSF